MSTLTLVSHGTQTPVSWVKVLSLFDAAIVPPPHRLTVLLLILLPHNYYSCLFSGENRLCEPALHQTRAEPKQ